MIYISELEESLDPNMDVRRTVALGTRPKGATLSDRRSDVGDDAVNVVEVSVHLCIVWNTFDKK